MFHQNEHMAPTTINSIFQICQKFFDATIEEFRNVYIKISEIFIFIFSCMFNFYSGYFKSIIYNYNITNIFLFNIISFI